MTLIIGSEGSMGKRYQAILKYLNEPFSCLDMDNIEDGPDLIGNAKRVVIATPTNTHLNMISMVAAYGIPVLCEKPLTKSKDELLLIENIVKTNNLDLTMMMQYQELVTFRAGFQSWYNYFRHGNDGLYWDCLQIIAMHVGKPVDLSIQETSPIWKCMINGTKLQSSQMDQAYIDFTRKWLRGEIKQSTDYLIEVHEKVRKHEELYAVQCPG